MYGSEIHKIMQSCKTTCVSGNDYNLVWVKSDATDIHQMNTT